MTLFQGILIDLYWQKVVIPEDLDACWGWSGTTDVRGYAIIKVYNGSRQQEFKASRIAYLAHHGTWPVHWALHHCDNPPCTSPRHVYDGTPADNVRDRESRRRGRIPDNRGERHGHARLTAVKVREIRARYDGTRGIVQRLAIEYGISRQSITDLLNGRTWTHVL